MVTVHFELGKSDGSREVVQLHRPGEAAIRLVFVNNSAQATVPADTDYPAPWELVGDKGDTIKVTWKTRTLHGTLIDGKIGDDAEPYPEGPYHDSGMGYLPALPEGE